jgi:hypothetical protein
MRVCFICLLCHGSAGAVFIFFAPLSSGHGKLSIPPAPGRRRTLLHPLRGPPGYRFPSNQIAYAE